MGRCIGGGATAASTTAAMGAGCSADGDPDEEMYCWTLEVYPGFASAYHGLVEVYEEQGQVCEGEKVFRQWLASSPEDYKPCSTLAGVNSGRLTGICIIKPLEKFGPPSTASWERLEEVHEGKEDHQTSNQRTGSS